MAITKVWIEEGCISCGMSEDNCPEVFKVKDVGAHSNRRGELFRIGGKN